MITNPNNPVRQVTPVLLTGLIPNHPIEKVGFFNSAGVPFDPSVAPTAAAVLMTGYTAHAVGNVAAGDTLNQAMGKIEARVAALEAA